MTQPEDSIIFHIAHQADIDKAFDEGVYECESLASEGFIHCCSEAQMPDVLERHFEGVKDLVLLGIDTTLLEAELRMENTSGGDELFPHVYGKLNLDAVVSGDPLK